MDVCIWSSYFWFLFTCSNLPFDHHELQDSHLPPAPNSPNSDEPLLPPTSPNSDDEPSLPSTSANRDEIFGLVPFLCASVPTIGATIEISTQPPSDPPLPPPLPKTRSKSPDHSYASSRLSKNLSDRDTLIWSLQRKVKSLEHGRKRDRVKLELARKKIVKLENGQLSQKSKKRIVQHVLGQGTLSSTLITNLINQAENPKGKSKSIF